MSLFQKKAPETLEWEKIKSKGGPNVSWRTRVHNGWLYMVEDGGVTFIPDPSHQWMEKPRNKTSDDDINT